MGRASVGVEKVNGERWRLGWRRSERDGRMGRLVGRALVGVERPELRE